MTWFFTGIFYKSHYYIEWCMESSEAPKAPRLNSILLYVKEVVPVTYLSPHRRTDPGHTLLYERVFHGLLRVICSLSPLPGGGNASKQMKYILHRPTMQLWGEHLQQYTCSRNEMHNYAGQRSQSDTFWPELPCRGGRRRLECYSQSY